MSAIIPLSPVDVIAATNERNFTQSLSFIISERISSPSARFLDSKPPDVDSCSKML
jgi:hypothetical protein